MAIAEENENYIKSAAERRLEVIKAQLVSQTQEDSVIGRTLKAQKRKELAVQRQPLVAQVQLKSGWVAQNRVRTKGGAQRGYGGGVRTSVGPSTPTPDTPTGRLTRVKGVTGSTTVLSPAATWTTEGYQVNKEQPKGYVNRIFTRDLGKAKEGIFKSAGSMWGGATARQMPGNAQASVTNLQDQFKKKKRSDATWEGGSLKVTPSELMLRFGGGGE